MPTCSMEDVLKRNDTANVVLLVRNTFYELEERTPSIARTKSEPALQCYRNTEDSKSVSDDGDGEVETCNDGATTSVIVRDLPCKVGCDRMMAELKHLGFDGLYNLLKFPVKCNKGTYSCKGYGFVNFTDENTATLFMALFENYRFDDINSRKVARVELASKQWNPASSGPYPAAYKTKSCVFDPAGVKAP
eukprot:TRINITY_DN5599_c1_g1_i1.p1 TRINITY_DN5599_c1_g1~~TRINITY_DN5599_c1_g1_i1.p1  ORF type:complete len:218 (+),score=32.23 TRINITY_DN5599_c1_g1_i1:83-655(+)